MNQDEMTEEQLEQEVAWSEYCEWFREYGEND